MIGSGVSMSTKNSVYLAATEFYAVIMNIHLVRSRSTATKHC